MLEAATAVAFGALTKAAMYDELLAQLQGLIAGQRNWVSNTSNAAALTFHALVARGEANVNWVGVYVKNNADEELILGPFQGEVACVIIPPGKGVCGAAAQRRATVVRARRPTWRPPPHAAPAAPAAHAAPLGRPWPRGGAATDRPQRPRVPWSHCVLKQDQLGDCRAHAQARRGAVHAFAPSL